MWAVNMSRHTVDVPSEVLRDKRDCHGQGNPHCLRLPLPLCGDDFLACHIYTVGPHFSNASKLHFPSTIETTGSKWGPQTSHLITQELVRNKNPRPQSTLGLNLHFNKTSGDSYAPWGLRSTDPEHCDLCSLSGGSYHILVLFISVLYFLFCILYLRANIVLGF